MEKTFRSWLESRSNFEDVKDEVISSLSAIKTSDSSKVAEDTPIDMFDPASLKARIKSMGSFARLTRKSRDDVMSRIDSEKPGTVFDIVKQIADPLEMR